ncbi:MAG: N-acetyl-gamma-glutamyl-phosphate reductase [Candidatus Caenarcaniphilales bacterium]|nr:N-acetyl-gamma-glutamyl-phosphate reductase [Candidatus Caenarcaniphilales bacterium]
MKKNKIKIGIAGITGYTGAALLNILINHPEIEIKYLCSKQHKGKELAQVTPWFIGLKNSPKLTDLDTLDFQDLDCFFTATPNGIASGIAEKVLNSDCKLIDLSADFRLKDSQVYEDWYSPLKPAKEEIINEAVYGLTEFNHKEIREARLLANPGCYPTASTLGVLPLLKNNIVDDSLCIIDAKSGTTGAGKAVQENLLFSEINESFSAYKVDKHRHTPEIEQSIELYSQKTVKVRFTPHLLPMKRGILSTIYLKPKHNTSSLEVQNCLKEHYKSASFVHVVDEPPKTKDVYGSNRCHIFSMVDERSELVVVISVIDNLMKGAAGQAVQNFNLMFSLSENLSLQGFGLLP